MVNERNLTQFKLKGNTYNTDNLKADLIKYADRIKHMNEPSAYKLANKIAKEYEKTDIKACVDEICEFKILINRIQKIYLKSLSKTHIKFQEINKSLNIKAFV